MQDIKNELDVIEEKIDRVLHDLEMEILGAARQNVRMAIADKLVEATNAVQATSSYAQASDDPQQQQVFATAISISGDAVLGLADNAR